MIACRTCGATVADTDTSCPSCGAALGADVPPTPPSIESSRRLLAGAGVVVAAGIVVASLVWRSAPAPEPYAAPRTQREAVDRFHAAVVAGRWQDVHAMLAEPPSADVRVFAAAMGAQQAAQGRVTAVRTDAMRLRRSASVPVLEVDETVRVVRDAGEHALRMTSFFTWHDGRWLFAFSAPAGEDRP